MTDNTEPTIEKYGYIKVSLDYAPTTNGKKFAKWCEEHGFTPLNGGRRAWCSNLSTYLRDASGVAYADGEPFLFYEEDLVDLQALIANQVREARIDELNRTPRINYGNDFAIYLNAYLDDRIAALTKLEAEL